MIQVTPVSEDFFYWDPESICTYPVQHGVEDGWFIESEIMHSWDKRHSGPKSGEVIYAR